MSDYIDRAALGIGLCNRDVFENKGYADGWNAAVKILKEAPAADVQEIKHGKWIEDGYCDIPCVCSCCGAEAQYTSTFKETFVYDREENLCSTGYEERRKYIRTPFCPNCGAKMDGGDNNA